MPQHLARHFESCENIPKNIFGSDTKSKNKQNDSVKKDIYRNIEKNDKKLETELTNDPNKKIKMKVSNDDSLNISLYSNQLTKLKNMG